MGSVLSVICIPMASIALRQGRNPHGDVHAVAAKKEKRKTSGS